MTLVTQHTLECNTRRGGECNCPMGRTWATVADIRVQLETFIGTAFKHEEAFLKHFCDDMNAEELVDCHMGDKRTKISVLVPTGSKITTTISTTKFIDWCNEINENYLKP